MKFVFIAISAIALLCNKSYSQIYPAEPKDLAMVILPEIPQSISFAGDRVPLENYDTRESLYREIFSTQYMHSRTMISLLNTKRYFHIIEPILKKNGVPADFKYLCVAESGLNPNVSSSAGASGLWQLMPFVGRHFGMEVGKDIDERYHIEMATEVACAHLKESYQIFGSWTLAAAAYNLGNAGVKTRIQKQGTTDYYDTFLPEETLRYMFRCIAWKMVIENPEKYGFKIGENDYYPLLTEYREVKISEKDIDWSAFARSHGTTYKILRELNHWIRDYNYANPKGRSLTVKIPTSKFRQR